MHFGGQLVPVYDLVHEIWDGFFYRRDMNRYL